MTDLEIMNALNEAIAILREKRMEFSLASATIWRKLNNAGESLEAQISDLLAPEGGAL